MRNFKTLAFFTLIILSACTSSEKNTAFDKGPMLENIAFHQAIPAYENSLEAFKKLDSTLNSFDDAPVGKNLDDIQKLWVNASINWAKTAPYHFGPIDELLIENNFHYFPVDTSKLKAALLKFNGDENFINEMGSNSRGLGALEFLFFSEEFMAHPKHIAFAKILSRNLVKLNQEILAQWKSKYAQAFASNTGNNINASITLLTNQWIELAEDIKNNKVGRPSGSIAGSEKNDLALQAPFSQTSSSIIQANVSALQNSFNGGEEKGVDDYLNALNIVDDNKKLLSDKINSQFDLLMQLLDGKDQPLSILIQKDAEKLDRIYLETLNLTILLKADMMGQLGLITTFSDSDGD